MQTSKIATLVNLANILENFIAHERSQGKTLVVRNTVGLRYTKPLRHLLSTNYLSLWVVFHAMHRQFSTLPQYPWREGRF